MADDKEQMTIESTESEPLVPISEGVSATNDKSDDNILDRLIGDDSDSSEPPRLPTASPGEEGLTESGSVAQDTEDSVIATEDEVSVQDPNSGKPAELGSEDYEKALKALRRSNVPQSVIDAMSEENPQELVNWGLERAKYQSEVDGYGAKVKELENQLEGGTDGEETQVDAEAQAGDQAQVKPADTEVLNHYQSQISDIFGDDAANAVMEPIRGLVQETANALVQQHQMIQTMAAALEQRELVDTRNQLTERFPKLADEEGFSQVYEQMSKLAKTGEYQDLPTLMSDAYRIKYFGAVEQESAEKKTRKQRDLGQPTTTSESKTPPKSMAGEAREDAALDALLSGKGFDGASAAYNG